MKRILSRAEMAAHLGVTPSQLSRFVEAGEFGVLRPRQRLTIPMASRWRQARPTVALGPTHYQTALEFALGQYYGAGVKADFATVVKRTAGQFIDNQVTGKLGELGFAEFAGQSGVEVRLDFEQRAGIPAQDVSEVRRGRRAWNPPGIRLSVKATRESGTLLIVAQDEFDAGDRRSDTYVMTRVGLKADHLLRVLLQAPALSALRRSIGAAAEPEFPSVTIVGFAERLDFPRSPTRRVGDLELRQASYVLRSGDLRTDASEWDSLFDRLAG